ncbi:aquaporin-12-like isoform X2 [Narcine bancroftii]|uniref:aquaporin-12-like isoform X2 n=1 Tax=Narcine bancroftii TaxID=1343680 RepID=UPI0038321FD0
MTGLNISCGYFFAVLTLCEIVRAVSRRLLPPWIYSTVLVELAACFQLGACWLELRMLVVIGLWVGGFGMDVVLTLLFVLSLILEATRDGAQANPLITLQELLRSNAPLLAVGLRVLSQFGGTQLASLATRAFWSWELTEFHLIQNMMAVNCSSAIQTSICHAAFIEATCAFLFHLVVMKFEGDFRYRILSKALTVTALVYAAGPYTTALFNPALSFSVTFHCSGNTLSEYMIVYWLGPFIGATEILLWNMTSGYLTKPSHQVRSLNCLCIAWQHLAGGSAEG